MTVAAQPLHWNAWLERDLEPRLRPACNARRCDGLVRLDDGYVSADVAEHVAWHGRLQAAKDIFEAAGGVFL
jgi:hypothetical protein